MYKRISIDVKTQNNMTIEQYTYLVAKYGEETVYRFFKRSVDALKRKYNEHI